MTQNEIVAFLSTLEMFARITPELLAEVTTLSSEITLPKNTHILRQGEVGDFFYILLEGTVVANLQSQDGDLIFLKQYGKQGTCIGEMALLGKKAGIRSVNVTSLTQVRLIKLPHSVLRMCFKEDVTLKRRLATYGYQRLISDIEARINNDSILTDVLATKKSIGIIKSFTQGELINAVNGATKNTCVVLSGSVRLEEQFVLQRGKIFSVAHSSGLSARMTQPGQLWVLDQDELNRLIFERPAILEMNRNLERDYYTPSEDSYVIEFSSQVGLVHAHIKHFYLKDGREIVASSVLGQDYHFMSDREYPLAEEIECTAPNKGSRTLLLYNNMLVGAKTNQQWEEWPSLLSMIINRIELSHEVLMDFKKGGNLNTN